MHADDEVRVARDLLQQARRVPEVPDVELDPDGVAADLVDERGCIAERVQNRPALDSFPLERLDGEPQAKPLRLPRDLAHPVDCGRTFTWSGEAQDRRRFIRRKDFERAKERVDARADGVGARQQR